MLQLMFTTMLAECKTLFKRYKQRAQDSGAYCLKPSKWCSTLFTLLPIRVCCLLVQTSILLVVRPDAFSVSCCPNCPLVVDNVRSSSTSLPCLGVHFGKSL